MEGIKVTFLLFFGVLTLIIDPSPVNADHNILWKKNNWERIEVPGAKCGNGEEYYVYLRRGQAKKLAVGFQEGGGCWDYESCFGTPKKTSLKPVKSFTRSGGIFSIDPQISSVANHTHVFFTYCTGDVFSGTHKTRYKDQEVHHWGYINTKLGLDYLVSENIISFENLEQFVLYGFSAGAIAGMLHMQTFNDIVPPGVNKVLLSDSPGLHFGHDFWYKFPKKLIRDYSMAFARNGLRLVIGEGNIAKQMPDYCLRYFDWKIGFLQSTRDIVMSLFFGDISPGAHRKKVLGPEGILTLTEDVTDNCSSWVPDTFKHTYLRSNKDSVTEVCGKTAISFSNDLVGGLGGPNYPRSVDEYPDDDIDYRKKNLKKILKEELPFKN